MSQQISVCIIAKNEEKYIETCLQALKPFDVEIVVVDTGSTDKTKEIAAKYTDSLYDFEWIGDFSAARNYAAKMAKHDYIFALDCDEFIEKFSISDICKILKKEPNASLAISINNVVGSGNSISKFFSEADRIYDRRFVHFVNRIHEQLATKDSNSKVLRKVIDTSVLHMGYYLTPEEKLKKNERNIEHLLKQIEEMPDDCYSYFQLGQSYAEIKENEKAYEARKKALSLKPPVSFEFMDQLLVGYAKSALDMGKYEDALSVLDYYDDMKNVADYMFYLGQAYYANGRLEEALKTFELATKCKIVHAQGTNSFFPYNAMALLYEKLGENEKAVMYSQMAQDALSKAYNLDKK